MPWTLDPDRKHHSFVSVIPIRLGSQALLLNPEKSYNSYRKTSHVLLLVIP